MYRKALHTSNYLNFHSYSLSQSKRVVFKALKDRTKSIPYKATQKQNGIRRVVRELKANGHRKSFMKSASNLSSLYMGKTQRHMRQFQKEKERARRVLNRESIKIAFKPLKTLVNVLKEPID